MDRFNKLTRTPGITAFSERMVAIANLPGIKSLEHDMSMMGSLTGMSALTKEISAISSIYESPLFKQMNELSKTISNSHLRTTVELSKALSGSLALNIPNLSATISAGIGSQISQIAKSFEEIPVLKIEPSLSSIISSLAVDLNVKRSELNTFLRDEYGDFCDEAESVLTRPSEELGGSQWAVSGSSEALFDFSEILAQWESIKAMLLRAGKSQQAIAFYFFLLGAAHNEFVAWRYSKPENSKNVIVLQTNNYIDQSTKVEQKVIVDSKTVINFGEDSEQKSPKNQCSPDDE